ncbi:4Fe-4S dicluster domain-containing protein, partial [Salmonella enterica]|uniref:4Fe-4S dicluster domain-containing protein n=1 Tax=Salmonella enterica TaxID=28901 RepID=UPI00398C30F8
VVGQRPKRRSGCNNGFRNWPDGAPRFEGATRKAEKCSMGYERLDIGMNPACVNACPVGALSIIELDADPVPDNAFKSPPGFPHLPQINPGTRCILARQPKHPEAT